MMPAYFSSKSEINVGHGVISERVISVVVTLYNYEKHITKALSSILKQTYSTLDLIIVEDCSTDDSMEVVRKWVAEHGPYLYRTRLICNRKNFGLSASRNIGFEAAEGDYVMVLDADNEIFPCAIEKLYAAALNAGAECAYSIVEHFGAEKHLGYADIWDPLRFAGGNYVDAMALIKKAAWKDVGGYYQFEIDGWEDYDLWCSFIDKGYKGVFVPELLCRYRVHDKSMLRTETNKNYEELIMQITSRHCWLKV